MFDDTSTIKRFIDDYGMVIVDELFVLLDSFV